MKQIIKNIFWLLLENGSRILLALVLNAILARALGVEKYGAIQYVLSLIVIFSSIGFICGAEVVVPILVNSKGIKTKIIISNVFWLRFAFSTLGYLSLILFVYFFDSEQIFFITLLMGTILLVGESFSIINAWLQANTNSKPRSIIVIFSNLMKCLIVSLLYIYNVSDVIYYVLAWVVEAYLVAVLLFLFYKNKTGFSFNGVSLKKIVFFFKKGFPFFIGLLMMYLFLRLDVIFLRHYTNLEMVGVYTAANQLVIALSTIAPILSMSIAPSIIYRLGVSNIKRKVMYVSLSMSFIAIILAIGFTLLSDYIIVFIFGNDFLESVYVFNYLVWVMVLHFLNEGLNVYLIKLANGKLLIMKWMLVLIASFLSYFIFIPKYNYLGAVAGYAIGNIVAILYSLYILYFYNRCKVLTV